MDIGGLTEQMEDYARHLKEKLPAEQQAIIDALVMAADIRKDRFPTRQIVARLRGAAMHHTNIAPVIAAHMDLIANELEKTR